MTRIAAFLLVVVAYAAAMPAYYFPRDNFGKSIVHLSEDSLVVEESWTEGGNICYTVNPPICPPPDRFKVRNTYAPRKGKITLVRSDTATYTQPQPEKWEFK